MGKNYTGSKKVLVELPLEDAQNIKGFPKGSPHDKRMFAFNKGFKLTTQR
jgi:hypothetical protein